MWFSKVKEGGLGIGGSSFEVEGNGPRRGFGRGGSLNHCGTHMAYGIGNKVIPAIIKVIKASDMEASENCAAISIGLWVQSF